MPSSKTSMTTVIGTFGKNHWQLCKDEPTRHATHLACLETNQEGYTGITIMDAKSGKTVTSSHDGEIAKRLASMTQRHKASQTGHAIPLIIR